ncbi:MAG: DUF1559 domain-containing protein [Pirellulaceae bacterium]
MSLLIEVDGKRGFRAVSHNIIRSEIGGFEQRVGAEDKNGMTVVELLVAIAIVGILVAICLPAIQYAREAARRLSCQNNLKQFGTAVASYHDAQRVVPISVSPWREGSNPAPQRNGKGWIVSILPMLEAGSVYEKISPGFYGDFFAGGGLMDPNVRQALALDLEVLHCPSDSSGLKSNSQYDFNGIEVTLTSYKGVIGDTRIGDARSVHGGSQPDCHRMGGCNGMFHRNTYQCPISFGEVSDGLSNTFLIGEDVTTENIWSVAYSANGDYASCNGRINYFPNTPNQWWNVVTFRSMHPGGTQFVMVDGSVHFVSQSIDMTAYRALSTRYGNEPAALP